MRPLLALLVVLFGLSAQASAQSCTGLCLQQVSCPAGGGTTTISGTVYAPNGTDPLPDVLVYIPNAPVDAFTAGVSCPVVGQPPSGSPLVGTTTAVDGTFTVANVPVGTNIPLVIQTGRWRRQVVVPSTVACSDTKFSVSMPKNQSEGDIPKIAIATGSADQVECVLRKVGVDEAEFTDPMGNGRINLFSGSGSPGARIGPSTLTENALMGDLTALSAYDVLMLPCEGGAYTKTAAQLANLIQFANAGGRVYSSHFSYVWMINNGPFAGVANWQVNQAQLPDGIATVDTSFAEGQTLAKWLQIVGATTTLGQMPISTLRHDMNGVIAPTQSWLTLNNSNAGNPVMQFVFNTPVGTKTNQCGRVLFNEYHVENPVASPANKAFPTECTSGPLTPQEKLLEFSLFELTSNGGAADLSPAAIDFGTQPVGFPTASKAFTWKNNSTFPASVTLLTATGDFSIASNNCTTIAAGGTCTINVVFTPTIVGPRTGVLTVGSSGSSLTSALTGTGTPDLILSSTTLDFGSLDVGVSSTKSLSVTNNAHGPVAVPPFVTTGDYAVGTSCGATVPANGVCAIKVTFKPTTAGPRPGTLTVSSTSAAYTNFSTTLTGNGLDFSIALSPTSSNVLAGHNVVTNATTTPLGGFSSPVALSCSTTAPASKCTPSAATFLPSASFGTDVTITTTSRYTVVGFGGLGAGPLWIITAISGLLLLIRRRAAGKLLRAGLLLVFVATASFSMTGCSGKYPDINTPYTLPGTYTYTLTVTDGTLTRSATYTLTVTAQ